LIAIVDYRAGNLTSVLRAVRHLGHQGVITDEPAVIRSADRVIFPGVGAAGETVANLRALGLDRVLCEEADARGKPLLGICIGVQVIFDSSDEDGGTACLGLLPGRVARFPGGGLKVPQIGWNQVRQLRPHPIFRGVPDGAEFYFVNSYHPVPADPAHVFAEAEYGVRFACVVGRRNLVATQFHLEKSGRVGLRMLDNFCRWDGDDAAA
jgi:glutamine amidotransferase